MAVFHTAGDDADGYAGSGTAVTREAHGTRASLRGTRLVAACASTSSTPRSAPRKGAITTTSAQSGTRAGRSPVQIIALIYGIVFLLVGVAGFIPGLTTNLDTLQFAGHEGDAMLLGIFHVSILHNIVHLLFGVAGVLLARTAGAARHYLLWGGLLYLVLWIYGLIVDFDSAANFVPLSDANNWLHLGLGVTMVALSFLPRATRRDTTVPETRPTES